MKKAILAIRLRQLGDILVTLRAVESLKLSFPSHRMIFMIDKNYHELLSSVDFIDELLSPPPLIKKPSDLLAFADFISDLRRMGIDLVLDFHSNPRSALISFLSAAPRRFGFDVRVRKIFYTDVAPRALFKNGQKVKWTSIQSALMLAKQAGAAVSFDASIPALTSNHSVIKAIEEKFIAMGLKGSPVGLNPGNPFPSKAWSEENFIELAKRLAALGRQVVIMWGPGEKNRALQIKTAAGEDVFVAPELRLEDLPEFLSKFAVVVTIDSGLKHMAVAAGIPTVTLFGPTSPDEWHTGGDKSIFMSLKLSCSPCRLRECPFGSPCMSGLTVDMVMNVLYSAGGDRKDDVEK